MTEQVLFVDDEAHLRHAAEQSFDLADMTFASFECGSAMLKALDPAFDGVIVTDIRMPEMNGMEVLDRVLAIDAEIPVILLTGHGDVSLAVQAMQCGAHDFLEKPFDPARLVASARRAIESRRLVLENRSLRDRVARGEPTMSRLVGPSAAMEALRARLSSIATTDADVLIEGQTGTGKAIAARSIHDGSARRAGPYVEINCASLPEAMIESELFGHEAGAFPGALRARYGKLQHAQRGTLVLDEIDSLPVALQGKLLHVLQDRTVTPLGSNEAIPLDLRVVAVAKEGLAARAEGGSFRSDLYYRLAVAKVRMPPLSERPEDVPHLFVAMLAEAAARHGCDAPSVPPALLHALAGREWPGNVRQLGNVAERHLLGLETYTLTTGEGGTLAERMEGYERGILGAALAAHGGKLRDVYEALGLSRKTLYEKLRRHGLDREDYVDRD
ncbi:sigma-54 dependent transcriptional regulator [Thalassococcus sp. S3]|uniref:sigma-54-dependent transcriptional regulator n=1 Tax=Thalassococcus sp. S3 TaxID=2017482 RepID=UPI001024602E|nr:sigma-54 dependent transcriptional regulator [Thalassococcus sp. S3]QBF33303.1 Fis family transcriptional regulator [Thalassococcus sp. S3]